MYIGQVWSRGAIDRDQHTNGCELPTRTKSDKYADPNGQRGKMHSCAATWKASCEFLPVQQEQLKH